MTEDGRTVYDGEVLERHDDVGELALERFLDRWRDRVNAGDAVLLVAADCSHVIAVPRVDRPSL